MQECKKYNTFRQYSTYYQPEATFCNCDYRITFMLDLDIYRTTAILE